MGMASLQHAVACVTLEHSWHPSEFATARFQITEHGIAHAGHADHDSNTEGRSGLRSAVGQCRARISEHGVTEDTGSCLLPAPLPPSPTAAMLPGFSAVLPHPRDEPAHARDRQSEFIST